MMKYNKNQKKRPPPHGLFWEWPMARRGGYHMFRICLYDLDTLPDSISSTLDIVWLLCNTSKCVKNAVFRKKTPPPQKFKNTIIPAYIWNVVLHVLIKKLFHDEHDEPTIPEKIVVSKKNLKTIFTKNFFTFQGL